MEELTTLTESPVAPIESGEPPPSSPNSSPPSLADIKVTITLEHYFLLRGAKERALRPYVTVDNTWLESQGLTNLPDGLKELIHLREIGQHEDGIRTLFELWPMEDWSKTFVYKDRKVEEIQRTKEVEKNQHIELDLWKRSSLTKLMSLGRMEKSVAMSYIAKAMNPVEPFDFRLAEKLEYPYRASVSMSNNQQTTEPK